MKIDKMYEELWIRHNKVIKEMKEKIDLVVSDFRNAVDKIPEDLIYWEMAHEWATTEELAAQDTPPGIYICFGSCSERYFNSEQVDYYLCSTDFKGAVPMNYESVKQLNEFLKKVYRYEIWLEGLDFYTLGRRADLQFIAMMSEAKYGDIGEVLKMDLKKAIPKSDVTLEFQGTGSDERMVIDLKFLMQNPLF